MHLDPCSHHSQWSRDRDLSQTNTVTRACKTETLEFYWRMFSTRTHKLRHIAVPKLQRGSPHYPTRKDSKVYPRSSQTNPTANRARSHCVAKDHTLHLGSGPSFAVWCASIRTSPSPGTLSNRTTNVTSVIEQTLGRIRGKPSKQSKKKRFKKFIHPKRHLADRECSLFNGKTRGVQLLASPCDSPTVHVNA